jgi:hypothetical protein
MTETNLWPPRPEIWECSTNKGSAAALPLYISAGCPTGVRCTSALGQLVLAFMTVSRDGAKQPTALLGVYPIRIPDPGGYCGGSGCLASKGYKNVYIPPSR